jgi:Zn-dependent M28 family amino/carboxypeptidase
LTKSRKALAAACAATLILAPNAFAGSGKVTPRDQGAKRFVAGVSVPEIVEHQTALQRIATLNDDTREVFSPGYQESLEYVVQTLEHSGYDPHVTQFNYPTWSETAPGVLNMVAPTPKTYRWGASDADPKTVDFITMANSPAATLKGVPVVPVGGIVDPPTGGSQSGCKAEDFAGVKDKVALVQRGTCAFIEKWQFAQAAGAKAVIIYDEGNTPERQDPLFVDNQPDPPATIPAVITSYALGNDFLQAYKQGKNPTVDLTINGKFTDRFLPQVIAETKGGDPNNVVVVGAHLDSVPEGPGINDDGSGTSTLLAQAQELASGHYKPRQKIRFAWWGAEENGLVGSSYYARTLSDADAAKIDVMLDYDMLSSPNYILGVYDGDGDDPEEGVEHPPGPTGSGKVEDVFDDWFHAQGRPTVKGAFDGRSDYVGFINRGIPAGGIYAGAEGVKTAEQEQWYGGAAGSWYDPCYHQICDNLMTVLTGVPPLSAEGLAPDGDEAAKRAAARKMSGGALRSLKELSAGATYAVYYWAFSKDSFGTGGHGHGHGKSHRGQRWQGHHRLGK